MPINTTPTVGDHVAAYRRACEKTSNLGLCYRELWCSRMEAILEVQAAAQEIAALKSALTAAQGRVEALEAGIDAHLEVMRGTLHRGNHIAPAAKSCAELAALAAGVPAVSNLPPIDPEMIPAGCALPAFDGVEEAQMALRRAGAAL